MALKRRKIKFKPEVEMNYSALLRHQRAVCVVGRLGRNKKKARGI